MTINLFEKKETIVKILNMIEESLSPFIGQFDPKKFVWSTSITIGHFEGEKWTDTQHNQYAELNVKLDQLILKNANKRFHIWSFKEITSIRTISGLGLYNIIKQSPIEIFQFASKIQFNFGSNSNQTGEFLITPILVYLRGGNEIEYQFGNTGNHGFYGDGIEANLIKLVERNIFAYFKEKNDPDLQKTIISVNRYQFSMETLLTTSLRNLTPSLW